MMYIVVADLDASLQRAELRGVRRALTLHYMNHRRSGVTA
jgi:hypothetical protein